MSDFMADVICSIGEMVATYGRTPFLMMNVAGFNELNSYLIHMGRHPSKAIEPVCGLPSVNFRGAGVWYLPSMDIEGGPVARLVTTEACK